jgi:hypothetical protein
MYHEVGMEKIEDELALDLYFYIGLVSSFE